MVLTMKNISCIYKISSPSGFYIGSAKKFKGRRNQHLSQLRRGIHANIMLQRAFHKYGEENIVFSIIEECDNCDLIDREQFYIDTLNPQYNIARTAGRMTGYKFTDEQKKRYRDSLLRNSTPEQRKEKAIKARAAWTEESKKSQKIKLTGRKLSPESIEKTRQANIGRPCSPEKRAKLALQKGWKHTDESRKKMSDALKGRTGKLCANSKVIVCSNGMEFYGSMDAEKWLRNNGFSTARGGSVTRVCRGERKKAYGLIWRYKNDDSIKSEVVGE